MMSEQALQKLVCETSQQFFGQPFNHRACFNSRLKTTGGRYLLKNHHLEFNPKVLEVHGIETLVGIIKHELCHYHLHLRGLGYRHQDQAFKFWLQKVGGLRYTPPLSLEAPKYKIECQKCHRIFLRQKKQQLSRYRCPCGGQLRYLSASV